MAELDNPYSLMQAGLWHLWQSRAHLERALVNLEPDQEYLREELEDQLRSMRILFDKVRVEEALLRDRDALQSLFASGLGEHLNGE